MADWRNQSPAAVPPARPARRPRPRWRAPPSACPPYRPAWPRVGNAPAGPGRRRAAGHEPAPRRVSARRRALRLPRQQARDRRRRADAGRPGARVRPGLPAQRRTRGGGRSRSITVPECVRGRRLAPWARRRWPRRGRGPQDQICGLVDDRLAFRGVRVAVAGTAASPPRAPLRERARPPISEHSGRASARPGFAWAWRGSPAQCL